MAGPTRAAGRIGYGLRSAVRHSLATLLATTALGVVAAHAVDGTWVGGSSDWTDPSNWLSNPSVPDGTASFASTGSTAVDNNNAAVSIGTSAAATGPSPTTRTSVIGVIAPVSAPRGPGGGAT